MSRSRNHNSFENENEKVVICKMIEIKQYLRSNNYCFLLMRNKKEMFYFILTIM